MDEAGVNYKIQTDESVSDKDILAFMEKLIHFDIDVLDENLFHSTYFANPELVGDGSGGGKMALRLFFLKLDKARYTVEAIMRKSIGIVSTL